MSVVHRQPRNDAYGFLRRYLMGRARALGLEAVAVGRDHLRAQDYLACGDDIAYINATILMPMAAIDSALNELAAMRDARFDVGAERMGL